MLEAESENLRALALDASTGHQEAAQKGGTGAVIARVDGASGPSQDKKLRGGGAATVRDAGRGGRRWIGNTNCASSEQAE